MQIYVKTLKIPALEILILSVMVSNKIFELVMMMTSSKAVPHIPTAPSTQTSTMGPKAHLQALLCAVLTSAKQTGFSAAP
jgi:hypothetical protein